MSSAPRRLLLVVGARPNFMKAAAVLPELARYPHLHTTLVHTGQHYDPKLSAVMFDQLGLPTPDVHLEVGSGTHAQQTAQVMVKLEGYLLAEAAAGRPVHRLLVVGDVNSTLAATMVGAKLRIPVAHIEAGLRSGDRAMPEEVNRIVTDALADLLLCSEPAGISHLQNEGRPAEAIHLVGNVMIDTLRRFLGPALARPILDNLELDPQQFGVVTLHRPANVDDPAVLQKILTVLEELADSLPLVFSVHPRTAARMKEHGMDRLARRIRVLEPLGYVDFLALTARARLIITDSGGLQEESTALGVPCLTMRPSTERPITVEEGTAVLIGSDADLLRQQVGLVLSGGYKTGRCPALWDGKAGARIAALLASE